MTKAQQKLESKGFKVIHCIGNQNGNQSIVEVHAKKGNQTYKGTSCTALLKRLSNA